MKNAKRGEERLILFAIFLFILTLFLCKSIYLKTKELSSGSGKYQKYSIRLKGESEPANGFRMDEIKALQKILLPEEMAYYTFDQASVTAGNNSDEARICGVEGDFYELNAVKLVKGTFLIKSDFEMKNHAAVIDARLAKKLFNSVDVAGLKIKVYGSAFTIIGVTAHDSSAVGVLTGSAVPDVYIPLSVMNEKRAEHYIINLELITADTALNEASIRDKVAASGKSPDDFYFTNYNELNRLAKQRVDLSFFIIGSYGIYLLLSTALNTVKRFIEDLRNMMKAHYLWDAVKKCSRIHLLSFVKMAAVLTGVCLLWKAISFDLYIPPERMPNDPTSLTQVFDVLKAGMKDFLTGDYLYTLHQHRMIGLLHQSGSIAFILCLSCMLLMLFGISKNKGNHIKSRTGQAGWLGAFFAISVVLSVFVILISGMPFELPLRDIILLTGNLAIVDNYQSTERRSIIDPEGGSKNIPIKK